MKGEAAKDDNKLGLIAGVHLIYVNAAGLDRLKRGGYTFSKYLESDAQSPSRVRPRLFSE